MVLKLWYVMFYFLINSILGIRLKLHTDEKTYLCYICDKGFQHLTSYQFDPKNMIPTLTIWNIQIHTGEFQHPVDIIMFIFKYRFKYHILASLSTLFIQFSCTECDFSHSTFHTGNHGCDLMDTKSAMIIVHAQIYKSKYQYPTNKYMYTLTHKMILYLLLPFTICDFSQVIWNTGKYNDVTMGKHSAVRLYSMKWS